MYDQLSIPHVLKQADIFAGLSDDHLEMIASLCYMAQFNAGDIVFEQNSDGSELYVIADGEIDIQIDPGLLPEHDERGPVTIATFRRGQSFGEMALVDSNLRSASASCAQNETWAVVIPREALMNLCYEQPGLGFHLMRNLAIDMAAKIRASGLQMREWLTWSRAGGVP